ASENIVDHFKLPLADVLGCSLEDLSSPAFPRIGVELKQLLRSEGMVPGRSGIPLELKGEDGSLLNVFVRSGLDDLQLLEIEPIEDLDRTNVQARLLSAFGNIRSPQLDIAKALDQAAREVKEA